jgi:hypothetical protein
MDSRFKRSKAFRFFGGGCSFDDGRFFGAVRGAGAGAGAGAADSVALLPPHIPHDRYAASAPSWRYVQAGQAQGSAGVSITVQKQQAASHKSFAHS